MFLTDLMLIKLGRWLRIMGIASESPAPDEIDDDVIIYKALKEGKILLTMDKGMAQNAASTGVKTILIPSKMIDVEDQLTYVIKEAGIPSSKLRNKVLCTECGSPIRDARREEVEGIVPEGILGTTDRFWKCSSCSHVYWDGSHWRNIQKTVAKVKACISESGA
ncbi:Mut7-C RNAse domain protein [uncultured archaeon]|nr:Mut7-C RNAse domain protein [uncultured archaeon]